MRGGIRRTLSRSRERMCRRSRGVRQRASGFHEGGDVYVFEWAVAFGNEIDGKDLNVYLHVQEWNL